MNRAAAVLLLSAILPGGSAQPAGAPVPPAPPTLGLPLQCVPGQDCWVANYADVDPSPAARDYQCGVRTYDGHDGVDFAIRDLGVMNKGVPVVASAAGKVKSVRDGMEDTGLLSPGAETSLRGRECGNGVVIRHGNGWQSQYCHLRKGSIAVNPGDTVTAGTVLGAVGMSGWAEFPHVHLAVRNKGTEIDPFTSANVGSGCQTPAQGLWDAKANPPYEPAAIYNAGFSSAPPQIDRIRAGKDAGNRLDVQAAALVLWVDMFGVAAGDRIKFTITGPDGASVVTQEQEIDKTQARRYMYVGKKRTEPAWRSGTYTGRVLLSRSRAGGVNWESAVERQVIIQ
jgi:hypothetical protein